MRSREKEEGRVYIFIVREKDSRIGDVKYSRSNTEYWIHRKE